MSQDVKVTFGGEMQALRNELNSLHGDIKSWSDKIANMGVMAFTAWGANKVFDELREQLSQLTDEIKDCINAAMEAEEVDAQLAAVVKSTGEAAGFTVEQLQDMATELEHISTQGDEAIKMAQTLLLKFKDIKGDEFKRAEKLMLDMAARMGGDVVGAANMLGRSLNNPARGMMLLQREGIALNDMQKELIVNLLETGRKAEAQNIIMKELETVYAGANEAAVNTTRGGLKQLEEMLGDIKEIIGAGMLPAINLMVTAFKKDVLPTIEEVAKQFGTWDLKAGDLTTFTGSLNELVRKFGDLASVLKDNFIPIAQSLIDMIKDAVELLPGAPSKATAEDQKWVDSFSDKDFKKFQAAVADASREWDFFSKQDAFTKRGITGPRDKDDLDSMIAAAQARQNRVNQTVIDRHKASGLADGDDAMSMKLFGIMNGMMGQNINPKADTSNQDMDAFHKAFPDIKQSLGGLKDLGEQLKKSFNDGLGGVKDTAKAIADPLAKTAVQFADTVKKGIIGTDQGFKAQKEDAAGLFNRIQLAAGSLNPADARAEKQLTATEETRDASRRAAEATEKVASGVERLINQGAKAVTAVLG